MTDLPSGKFAAMVCDPPWRHATYSQKGKGRSAEAYYDAMSIDDIKVLPVGRWAAPDCVLLLWITDPQLPMAFDIIAAWGFTFKTVGFYWAKLNSRAPAMLFSEADFVTGLGHWTRANAEQCLLATRGHPKRLNADVRKLIISPRREHSRKPDELYERVERLVRGSYLELFSSAAAPHRDQWTRWLGKARAPEWRWKSDSYPGAEDDRPPEAA